MTRLYLQVKNHPREVLLGDLLCLSASSIWQITRNLGFGYGANLGRLDEGNSYNSTPHNIAQSLYDEIRYKGEGEVYEKLTSIDISNWIAVKDFRSPNLPIRIPRLDEIPLLKNRTNWIGWVRIEDYGPVYCGYRTSLFLRNILSNNMYFLPMMMISVDREYLPGILLYMLRHNKWYIPKEALKIKLNTELPSGIQEQYDIVYNKLVAMGFEENIIEEEVLLEDYYICWPSSDVNITPQTLEWGAKSLLKTADDKRKKESGGRPSMGEGSSSKIENNRSDESCDIPF